MYRTVAIEASLACSACRAEIPIGTLDDSLACACGRATPFPWQGMFDLDYRGHVLPLAEVLPGLKLGTTAQGASRTLRVALEIAPIACAACDRTFSDAQLGAITRFKPFVACECGTQTPARKPPDALVTAYPETIALVGETANRAQSPHVGVVVTCGECGAVLAGATCASCGSPNARPPAAGTAVRNPRFAIVFRV